jgi:hypothetical protein
VAQAEEKQHTLYLNDNRNWTSVPFYNNKVFFLKDGRIGMECGGRVIVRTIEHWMSLGQERSTIEKPGTITLDRDYFEHLLNALATQKFLYHVNADGLSEGEEKVGQMQREPQQAIDAAWRKGMDMLYKSTKDEGITT